MEWDAVVAQIDLYIWALSHQFAPMLISTEPSDLHQEGLIMVYEIFMSGQYGDKPIDELAAIFRTVVSNEFKNMVKKAKIRKPINMELNLEAVSWMWGYDGFHEVWLKYYQDFLGTKVSPEAARLLEELLNPSPPVYRMLAITQMRRNALKNQGFNVRGRIKLTNLLIGKALGFHPSKTKKLVAELQRVWKQEMVHN